MKSLNVVTGGGGFIGLNLVDLLLRKGEAVAIIDNQTEGFNAEGLSRVLGRHKGKDVKVIHSDVLSSEIVTVCGNAVDRDIQVRLYHLAAVSHVDTSINYPMLTTVNNVVSTARVLELTRAYPDWIRLLVVSTDEVYGDEGPFPTPLGANIRPSSPYSASKAAGDHLLEAYRRTYKIKALLSRCCNNFGPYQNHKKFLPVIIRSIREGIPIPVYGNGQQLRQWVPVQEHAKRLINQMESGIVRAHVGGFSLTNLELIRRVSRIVGKEPKIEFVKDRPGHDVRYELADKEAISEVVFDDYLTRYVRAELA